MKKLIKYFDEYPELSTLIGSLLIVVATFYLILSGVDPQVLLKYYSCLVLVLCSIRVVFDYLKKQSIKSFFESTFSYFVSIVISALLLIFYI